MKSRGLKSEPGPDLVVMGSGSIVAQLCAAGLVDEYEMVMVPIALGAGRTMLEGLATPSRLALERSRGFANGNVVLWYWPMAPSGRRPPG